MADAIRRLPSIRGRGLASGLACGVALLVALTPPFDSSAAAAHSAPAQSAPAQSAPAATPSTPPAPIADAERGLAVYSAHCASCHGPTGRGDGPLVDRLPSPPPSLADRQRMDRLSPAELYATVTNGRLAQGMPPFSRLLNDAERRDVVAAVRSLAELHPLRLAVGRAAWTDTCAACHGDADGFRVAPPSGEAAEAASNADQGAGLASLSPAALAARFDAVDAHRALATPLQAKVPTDAALAVLHARGTRPLMLPGLTAGGRIEGRIVDGSGAALATAGLTATLSASIAGLDVDWGLLVVDADGWFGASDLAVGDGVRYEPRVRYQGVRYAATQPVTLTATAAVARDVLIHVFEADPTAPVRVAGISGLAQADAARGELAVFEVWRIDNPSDRTRVSTASSPTFHLPLPIGARNVVLEDRTTRGDVAAASTPGKDGLECRLPVPPGGLEIVVNYAMPYRGTTATLQRTLAEGADMIGWVLADAHASAESDALGAPAPDAFGDQPVLRYVGGPVAAGKPWTIRIRGLPPAAAVPGSAQDVLGPAPAATVEQGVLANAALVLAVVGIVAALWVVARERGTRFGRPARTSSGGRASGHERPARAYAATIVAISALEERYERGEIARNAFHRRRGALVARALALRAPAGGVRSADAALPTAADAASEEG